MGAINKVTANQLMHIAGVSAKQYKKVPWHTTTITVRQLLPANEYYDLIDHIISDCQTPEGTLAIELLDLSTKANIVGAYAFVDLPKDYDKLFYLIYSSDLYKTVCSAICPEQLDAIMKTINLYVR